MTTGLRNLLFVYAIAWITVAGSERMFWYWQTGLLAQIEGAVWYSICTAALVVVLRRFEVHSMWGLVLALPIYGYVTEGVLTPVLYEGGPTPIFPLFFTGWHGLFAVGVLFIAVRRLALDDRVRALTALSVGIGVFFGTWSITSLLDGNRNDPELIADGGPLHVLDPLGFTGYAAMVVGVLIAGHVVVDRIWPADTSRLLVRAERPIVVVALLAAGLWSIAAPWALPMFVGLCWLQFRLLRRHREARQIAALGSQATLLDSLGGPVRRISLLPLLAVFPSAALAYWAWWLLAPSQTALGVIYFGIVTVQTVGAGVLLLLAWRHTRPHSADHPDERDVGRSIASVG